MRMRSNTIYAESFDEFLKLSNQADVLNEKKIRTKKKTPTIVAFGEDEELGMNKDYSVTKPLSIIEADEEKELIESINNLNISFHQRKTKNINDDSCSEISSTKDSSMISDNQDKILFLSQNIAVESYTVKYLVLGDTKTGKSTLINTFNFISKESYTPTKSLEIKKSFFNYSDTKTVKIEFWDTNRQVISSKLIQTYMKIANGFIFLCDIADRSSIIFLKNQIDNVLNFSSANNCSNMLFYLNISLLSNNVKGEIIKENMELFSSIADHYHLETKKINALNLKKYNPNDDNLFKQFLKSCIKGLD